MLINEKELVIGPCADLYGANLRVADLYRANLHGANLHGANLRGATVGENVIVTELFAAGPLGSRNETLFLWATEDKAHCVWAGCFRGSGAEFMAAVAHTHDGNEYDKQYAAIYEFFCNHIAN